MGTFSLDIIHCLDEREVKHLLEWLCLHEGPYSSELIIESQSLHIAH